MLRLSKYMKRLAHTSDQLCPLTDDDLKRLQNHLLGMFLDIARVCDKHGIRVMMCSGSALGATVRHGGFIPWDDDLDVMMMREDYDRFLAIAPRRAGRTLRNHGRPDFRAKRRRSSPRSSIRTPYSRAVRPAGTYPQGVFIDIFPLEYLPANPVVRSVKHFIANGLSGHHALHGHVPVPATPSSGALHIPARGPPLALPRAPRPGLVLLVPQPPHVVPDFRPLRALSALGARCTIRACRTKVERIPLAAILPVGTASFDGHRVPVPHDPHTYLTCVYGDYMKIPPVEQRERHYVVEFRLPE